MICLILLSKLSDVPPAFTCANAIGKLWSICLELNILRPSPYCVLYVASDAIEEYSLNNLITACCDS